MAEAPLTVPFRREVVDRRAPLERRRRALLERIAQSVEAQSPQTPPLWSPSLTPVNAANGAPKSSATPSQASTVDAPALIRTSTIQQASASMSSAAASHSFDPYSMYPSKAVLKLNGELDSMVEGWTIEEWEAKRRLVQFTRWQNQGTIYADFKAVALEDHQPNSICISCIWWDKKKDFYVTSVDLISLLESLVAIRFTVEEKNRIRRNLEGFRPLTVSKLKPDSEEFFKVIMGFPSPKPRNIEKDVKVLPWKILAHALRKIIGKYSASYSSTASALPTPMNSHYTRNGASDSGTEHCISGDRHTSASEFVYAEQDKLLLHNRPQLVTWTCLCGAQLYDHYTEIVPGSLKQLQQRLRQENSSSSRSWQTFWNALVAWTTSRPSAANSNPNKANAAPDSQTQATQEDGESAVKNIPGNAGSGAITTGLPLSGSTDTSNALQSPQPQVHPAISYLLLCFPEGLSGLKLHQQQILHATEQRSLPNQVVNDRQLFNLLRKKYASERRLFISRFWPKTVIRVSLAHFLVDLSDYVELKHYACQDGRANCRCIPPPDMIQPATNAQYHCLPRDPPLKPPIGTNYLTHYFQNPDCIKSENLVCTLNQVPKRLGQCMPTSGGQRVEAWGIEFEEGWDRGRVRNAIFGIIVIGCLLFAILWSVLLKDMQSAFGVSSFFVAILASVGGYIASAEPRIVHK
ncbi:hypothetical protein GJ744_004374 [Endocarpon pusillum]|uniref:DUF7082 domain-containing protein n=1 Tax=Endocarpon pusillum TaxID=364733 RepID=A0A8H7ATF8_9EURO|nr:hypothetical protein GJ744_004374 [Endocarpon pusillum]